MFFISLFISAVWVLFAPAWLSVAFVAALVFSLPGRLHSELFPVVRCWSTESVTVVSQLMHDVHKEFIIIFDLWVLVHSLGLSQFRLVLVLDAIEFGCVAVIR